MSAKMGFLNQETRNIFTIAIFTEAPSIPSIEDKGIWTRVNIRNSSQYAILFFPWKNADDLLNIQFMQCN